MAETRLSQLSDADIRALDWYYTVEMRPGVFTNGSPRSNMIPNRMLLDRINFKDMRVLDIGAQEGVFSVLLSRAGAQVTGYDRFDLSERIQLIQEAYGTRFRYFGGVPFPNFVRKLHAKQEPLFDGIFLSGVLYHVLAPTLFVYLTRTLLKPGGILVLETWITDDADAALYFNQDGKYWNAIGSYYLISAGWLDYYLRFLGFRIVDVEFTTKKAHADKTSTRVALTAVLTDDHPVKATDQFGRHTPWELLDFQRLRTGEQKFAGEERISPAAYDPELYHESVTPLTLDLARVLATKAHVPNVQNLRILQLEH